jgi:hypothetical protein
LATVALEGDGAIYRLVIAFDEDVVLFSRGKLWRVNPISA